MSIHILGIRHHGVGSAQNLLNELNRIKPDLILIEGAEEITEAFSYADSKEMVPPVAVMAYDSSNLKHCVFYPFSCYSPEWIALQYAKQNDIGCRAIDLPAAISFAINDKENEENFFKPSKDPLDYLAEIAGFPSGESWWEYHFEQGKENSQEHFDGVMHVMSALREEGVQSALENENVLREAYMRMLIRKAQNELYENIVIVCGAWHAPALKDLEATGKGDIKLLKALPKTKSKILASWIPWTNERLSTFSSYGAGIYSPGWYEHLWKSKQNTEIEWLTHVANLLRSKGMDVSTAHVIESYTLSRSLAALRQKYFISLKELNEATLSVMCMGDTILLDLINKELIIGNSIGKTPPDIPKVPLQNDFEQNIKQLRITVSAEPKQLVLDLRKELDLQRSIFFYRLQILSIPWASQTYVRTKGSFKEAWNLNWQPEMMLKLIDKAHLGNTINAAAQTLILNECNTLKSIADATTLIQNCLPSELFESIDVLLQKVLDLSVVSTDLIDLMKAVPNLVELSRYGNVRNSDLSILQHIVEQLLVKIFIGLPNACYGLDEESSLNIFELISQLNTSVTVFNQQEYTEQWFQTLHVLIDKDNVNPIILGCTCRLLLDTNQLSDNEANTRISYALSVTGNPHNVALWLEGFLKGSGLILMYDNVLWNMLYQWVESIPSHIFIELLPLLRRTFSKFEFGERRQIGIKAKDGIVLNDLNSMDTNVTGYDLQRGKEILPIIKSLAGF